MPEPGQARPFSFIVFGASGSLARLKIFPALYELRHKGRMPAAYTIVGYARTPIGEADFRRQFAESVKAHIPYCDRSILEDLLSHVHYAAGQYNSEADYRRLLAQLKSWENGDEMQRIAYLSVPPSAFDDVFQNCGAVGFDTEAGKLRLIIEKPLGYDLGSARQLQDTLHRCFQSDQIFLLDHYLGKEAVANLLSLRYANTMIAALMNRTFVSHVQISALEIKDIEGRAGYFDNVGILRDMIQSHVLQTLTVLAMSLPENETAEEIHKQKLELLQSIRIPDIPSSVVRGQYAGYADEKGVPPGSQTETFAALRLELDHPLWKGIPVFLRSGKALKRHWTGVVVEFKPHCGRCAHQGLPPNRLVFQIQPDQQIGFHLLTKKSGKTFDFSELETGRTLYCSEDCLSEHAKLLLDTLDGNQDLFLDFKEVFEAWKVVDPIQETCNKMRDRQCDLWTYPKGSYGPDAANALIAREGFAWYNPETAT